MKPTYLFLRSTYSLLSKRSSNRVSEHKSFSLIEQGIMFVFILFILNVNSSVSGLEPDVRLSLTDEEDYCLPCATMYSHNNFISLRIASFVRKLNKPSAPSIARICVFCSLYTYT